MQLSHNQQQVMAMIDKNALTAKEVTWRLNTSGVPDSRGNTYSWRKGQVRSILNRLWKRDFLLKFRWASEGGEYNYSIKVTNGVYEAWKEQFKNAPDAAASQGTTV